jgi:hypothetical protein
MYRKVASFQLLRLQKHAVHVFGGNSPRVSENNVEGCRTFFPRSAIAHLPRNHWHPIIATRFLRMITVDAWRLPGHTLFSVHQGYPVPHWYVRIHSKLTELTSAVSPLVVKKCDTDSLVSCFRDWQAT